MNDSRAVRIARGCILAAVVLVPLATTALPFGLFPLTHDVVELPKQVVLRVLAWTALALLASVRLTRGGTFRASRAWWVLAAWLGWTALATATSLGPATSLLGRSGRLDGLVSAVAYASAAFVAGQLLADPAQLRMLARAAVAGSVPVSAYGLAQNLGFEPLRYLESATVFGVGRAFSTLGNPVYLGGYLVMVLPIAFALAVSDRTPSWRWVGLAGLALGMPALLVTFSRGAWLPGTILALVLLYLLIRRHGATSLSVWTGAGIGAVWAIALSVRSLKSASQFSNIVERSSVTGAGSIAERIMIWRSLLSAVFMRPVLGWGPDMIPSAFEAFRSAQHAKAFPQNLVDNAHDWPLQLAVGSGLPGALLGAGVWVMALAGTARKALSPDPSRDTWVLSGVWLGLAGYAIYLLSAVATTGSQALAWVLVGALIGYTAEKREICPVRGAAVVPWIVGALCVALVAWTLALAVADNRYLRHRAQMRGDSAGDPLASAKTALALSPLDAHYRAAVAQAYFSRASVQSSKEAAEADYSASLATYASAIKSDPGDWWVALAYAEVLRAGGRTEEAARLLQQAREAAPMNPYLKAVK